MYQEHLTCVESWLPLVAALEIIQDYLSRPPARRIALEKCRYPVHGLYHARHQALTIGKRWPDSYTGPLGFAFALGPQNINVGIEVVKECNWGLFRDMEIMYQDALDQLPPEQIASETKSNYDPRPTHLFPNSLLGMMSRFGTTPLHECIMAMTGPWNLLACLRLVSLVLSEDERLVNVVSLVSTPSGKDIWVSPMWVALHFPFARSLVRLLKKHKAKIFPDMVIWDVLLSHRSEKISCIAGRIVLNTKQEAMKLYSEA